MMDEEPDGLLNESTLESWKTIRINFVIDGYSHRKIFNSAFYKFVSVINFAPQGRI